MEKLSLKEFERRWGILLARGPPDTISATDGINCQQVDKQEDPFDCSSLAVPPTYDSVNSVALHFAEQWRDLDQRKVAEGMLPQDQDGGGDSDENVTKKPRIEKLPYWYTNQHVRLPEQFDYATRQPEPPADDGLGDRVVSLQDPSQSTSYHQELWKLFRSIPTAETLEKEALQGARLPNIQALTQEMMEGAQGYPRLDGHALSRLRTSDRHELPPYPPFSKRDTATIRFECWRRQPKRGATPDTNRAVLEFLGSQTLQDFHHVLVNMLEDGLWTNNNPNNADKQESSGFFFLEGIFYTVGSVDYTASIQTWLTLGTCLEQKDRADFLGLCPGNAPVRSMADTRLDEIELRLGMRYHHVCHGDVECCIIATDQRLAAKASVPYPILHDIWTPSYATPECEACRHRVAVIATATSCLQTGGGHRALCEECSRHLKLQVTAPDQIERYAVWKGQADLSTMACRESLF